MSEDGRKDKSRPKFTSTPSKTSKLVPPTFGIQPGDPAVSTISSGKKTTKRTHRNQILSTENNDDETNVEEPGNHQALNDSNELRNPSLDQNATASTPKLSRTRSLSRSRHEKIKTRRKTSNTTGSPRENYSEHQDFEKELKLGMDPLLACTLLKKVLFLLRYNLDGINYF